MKIEKVSDNQIRCTLTKADLAERHLKLSELAYGTEKAKNLFRDMMQQASYEFGFEAEDIPLMIEAIPLSSESIILIITKVESPEELDTRFSKFAPPAYDDNSDILSELEDDEDEEPILFNGLHDGMNDMLAEDKNPVREFIPLPDAINQAKNAESDSKAKSNISQNPAKAMKKYFIFNNLDELTEAGKVLVGFYDASNSLFKDSKKGVYALFINKGSHSNEDFNKICNILSEYSSSKKYSDSVIAYYEEHHELIIKDKALQTLSEL